MKRRNFGLLAGTSMLALMGSKKSSYADTPDASLLNSTLTPFGAERAGNAAGTIPPWTGGMTEIPAGTDWDPSRQLPPDFFASDPMLYEVNASNVEQYADVLSEGTQALIKARGFYLKVYPTHRTAAAPQWVYEQTALNVGRATAQDNDYRLGFNGAYGGPPFPIPSTTDPLVAGAQIMWNHTVRYSGECFSYYSSCFTNANGTPVLATGNTVTYTFDYYQPGGSPETFSGYYYRVFVDTFAPATSAGQEAVGVGTANQITHPQMSWSVLAGQGRVRRTPNLMYDVPSGYGDGIYNYDESGGFNGPIWQYDWKLLGKKEILIPYNSNKMFTGSAPAMNKANFYDPEYVRWELHRCWEVEATLHAGYRNVLARRRVYVDEDDWNIHITDSWDGGGNPLHYEYVINVIFPNLPGHIYGNAVIYNLQTGQYVSVGGSSTYPPYDKPYIFTPYPASLFNPQAMASTASY